MSGMFLTVFSLQKAIFHSIPGLEVYVMFFRDSGHNIPRLTLPLLSAIYLVAVFLRSSPSVLALDLAETFQVTLAEVSILSGGTMLAYGLVQIPAGILADRFGGRRITFIMTLLMACGTLLFAAAQNITSAAIARFITGLGSACLVPSLVLLAHLLPPKHFAGANAFVLFIGHMGMLAASAPLAFLDGLVGWRLVMGACGFLALALALFLYFGMEENSQPLTEASDVGTARTLFTTFQKLVSTPHLLPLMMTYCLHVAVFYSLVSFWWTPFLLEGKGLPGQFPGAVMFIGVVALVILFPLVPKLTCRLGGHRPTIMFLLALALVSVLGMCLLSSASMLALSGVVFIAAGAAATSVFTSLKELVPVSCLGLANGCLSTLPFILSPVFQWTFGAVLEWRFAYEVPAEAFTQAMYVHVAGIGLALFCCLCVRETYRDTLYEQMN